MKSRPTTRNASAAIAMVASSSTAPSAESTSKFPSSERSNSITEITRELSSAIFLVGPHTRVISVMLFDLSEEGNFEVLSALGAMLLLATIAIAALAFLVVGRDFMLRGS